MPGSTREAAGCWEPEFARLLRDIEKKICVTVECMEFDDIDITYGITYGPDKKTPKPDPLPTLNPVRLDIGKAMRPNQQEGQTTKSYKKYEARCMPNAEKGE